MGSDDEVRATRESQQHIELSDSGNSAKKRAAVEARDYGAITDTVGLVRIMGCDPCRLLGFSPYDRKFRQIVLGAVSGHGP